MKVSEFTIKHLSKIINGDCGYTPYLTGSTLVELFNRYGFRDTYGQGFPSRWLYVEEKIKKLNRSIKLAKVIEEIVDPRSYYDTEFKVAEAVEKINKIILHDGYLLIEKGKRYKIVSTESVDIEPESLGEIENDFLTEQIKKCDDKILEGDFDGAITNARTLFLNLDPSNIDYSDSIKQILSGLISIINGLANMRNEMSDAHTRRYKPEKRHSKLAVNSSKTLSEFLIDTLIKQYNK